ncbi:hypothetical protein [Pseudomonas aeruginosa]|uniref:hypothetical protein n=1 Tax=Pseudomonas aeruginosa TaxID=287 RepID=UPI000F717DCE|nr:hypothetical protein [Pseudomonas aeruginosa]VEF98829.1 Uncharacterised protein [Pseudomonas aeruginosa]
MSNHKHTPGPWEIERYSDGLIQIVGDVRIVSDDEENVTTVVEAVARGDEANARLISAAPELLEALVALVECEQTTPALWEAARSAIAKATA